MGLTAGQCELILRQGMCEQLMRNTCLRGIQTKMEAAEAAVGIEANTQQGIMSIAAVPAKARLI
jgi:hypothetical protein